MEQAIFEFPFIFFPTREAIVPNAVKFPILEASNVSPTIREKEYAFAIGYSMLDFSRICTLCIEDSSFTGHKFPIDKLAFTSGTVRREIHPSSMGPTI